MQFYQRLKEVREFQGMTQQSVADALGILRPQYARYEAGSYEMPFKHYKTLASLYNVSIDYLAGLIDTPEKLDRHQA